MFILEKKLIELSKAKACLYYDSMTQPEGRISRNGNLFQEKAVSLAAGPRTAAASATADIPLCSGAPSELLWDAGPGDTFLTE